MPRTTPSGASQRVDRGLALAPITRVILWANVVVFALEVIESRSIEGVMGVPLRVLLAFGANYAPLTVGVHQYERLLAACFVHGGLLHVAFNMSALFQIGPFVERAVGAARYVVLYVLTGVAASTTSLGWGLLRAGEPIASVGASGAICGVMGAAVVVGVRIEGWQSPIARQIGFWLLVTLVLGASVPNIDNAAHVGGLVAGGLVAISWRRGAAYSRAATIACVGVCAALSLAAGASIFYRDATDQFALSGPNDRSHRVGVALKNGDCNGAREALAAFEAVAKDEAAVVGLRKDVESSCREGARPPTQ